MKRVLRLDDATDVVVDVDYPKLDPDTDGHYVCNYTITGLPKLINGSSMGVDEIQALDIAMQLIGNRLYTRSEFKTGRLKWPFSPDALDIGFPKEA